MQNQFHELAKTLPPPRKQNTACDHCRHRKVKCNQLPGQDKYCASKHLQCTHRIQHATTLKKRNAAAAKRPRALSSANPNATAGSSRISVATEHHASPGPASSIYPIPTSYGPSQGVYSHYYHITMQTPTRDIIAYLFLPPHPPSTDVYPPASANPYADWGDMATQLATESSRINLAIDLIEVFFQIVHTRLPLLNPAHFRARIHESLGLPSVPPTRANSPLTPPPMTSGSAFFSRDSRTPSDVQKPLHPALVATVIAWGAKFSENPILTADRKRNGQQSLIAKTLINRARDLAEDLKVHRIPSADHVVIALLIEPMQNQSFEEKDGFHGFWLMSAIRLLLDLQINHKSVMSNIQDPEDRGTMIFAWWMACLADAYRSVYYRRKPMLDDDDYDIDFYTVGPVPPDHLEAQDSQPSPREQLEVSQSSQLYERYVRMTSLSVCPPQFLGYYRASHALARIARQMSRQLWRPATESDGIPLDVLRTFMRSLNEWREEHLKHVGVPNKLNAEWDFVSAVTACASDATYHIMWIVLFNALDDFGIREVNDLQRTAPEHLLHNAADIDDVKRRAFDEALHGATRIAGLAGVLTDNQYLRLDSAVMHVSCIQAGTLLARLCRPEVVRCIEGLRQYSYAYEECAEQANDIQRLYTQSANSEQFNHMADVVPKYVGSDPGQGGNAIHIDQPMFGGTYQG
ncbi:hypothetical protein AcV5_007442 [Taiwanofungus camphoratus]|nr:hypothetical protein AcV5_007442 [Antrodia cinnamomea]